MDSQGRNKQMNYKYKFKEKTSYDRKGRIVKKEQTFETNDGRYGKRKTVHDQYLIED